MDLVIKLNYTFQELADIHLHYDRANGNAETKNIYE
jgi:hypothetical protein